MPLLPSLESFLADHQDLWRNRPLIVAFSGGPDSTALLWALGQLTADHSFELYAAHLDHRLDKDSPRRAQAACDLARTLGAEPRVAVVERSPQAGESLEVFAREQRYRFLGSVAKELGSRMILTAHHAEDQAETVLLRLLFGSGLSGMAAIRPRFGKIFRPLLPLRKAELERSLEGTEITPILDPTNRDLSIPRNRLRRCLLPHLEATDPDLVPRLGRIADAAARCRLRSEELLANRLGVTSGPSGAVMKRDPFLALPSPLRRQGLEVLARRAGARYPVAATVRRELLTQLARPGRRVGCDAGHGWRLEAEHDNIRMARLEPIPPSFAYTSNAPGVMRIPELAVKIRIEPGNVADWMFQRHDDRVGLSIHHRRLPRFEIRNRRPGDRIRPLGAAQERKLKSLLNAHRVPRARRDAIPLLLVDGEIAWVPGIATSETFRVSARSHSVWSVKIEPLPDTFSLDDSSPVDPFPGRLDRKVAAT